MNTNQRKSQVSKQKSKNSGKGLAKVKELERTHIREFLPYVSLETLKAISELINAEMGIKRNDTPAEQTEPK